MAYYIHRDPKTKNEQEERCYRQNRYSNAFAQPIGFICFRDHNDMRKARENERQVSSDT